MIKNEKGVTLISLIVIIMLMLIISSTVVNISYKRFEINNFKKLQNDIELLEEKVSNYYLKYGGLPVLRKNSNEPIKYTYSVLDFGKNSGDNATYYILDLNAMDGIALNYGKDGFNNPNNSKDVYIINELTHIIYYVSGVELEGTMYYYITKNGTTDNIPPSKPEIKVISGEVNDEGKYTTDVEIVINSGKDNWSGIAGTTYSLNGGTNWSNLGENNIFTLTEQGTYIIKAKSYDKANNYSEEVSLTIVISK